MKAKELEKLALEKGWEYLEGRGKGSHRIYKHKDKKGLLTIPFHGSKEIPKGTEQSILKKIG